jgi:hypothetical protein
MLLPVGEQPHYIHDFCCHCRGKKKLYDREWIGEAAPYPSGQKESGGRGLKKRKTRHLKEDKRMYYIKAQGSQHP